MSDPRNYESDLACKDSSPDREDLNPARPSDLAVVVTEGRILDRVRIEIEPDPSRQGDLGPVETLARFSDRADEIGSAVRAIAERLRNSLESGEATQTGRWQMAEIGMDFGLSLEAETGIIVCKGKTAASFTVSIRWKTRADDGAASADG